ncbi:MAG: dTMP kinase [Treponema sp.]|jgi:dTMP kinase|nr:dTMP kinase [Treponema sp.]
MKVIPNFVVFEGGDGCGTSTQLDLLRRRFAAAEEGAPGGLPVLHGTSEPTRGPVGALIREALGGKLTLRPETLARLFSADREEHLFCREGVVERCGRGELVVCDRYVLSSLAYQSIACGEDLPLLLNQDFPPPELLLYFDLDPDIAVKRMEKRREREIFEYRDFQVQVRERYLGLLPRYARGGTRIVTIDASQGPEKVAEDLWSALKEMPIFVNR